jgi:hypothetical protein
MVVRSAKTITGRIINMRLLLPVLSVLALSACEPPSVATQSGVGFQDYALYHAQQSYLTEREAEQRRAAPAPAAAPAPTFAPAPMPASSSAALAADTMAALGTPAAGSSQPLSALAPAAAPGPAPAAVPAVATGTGIDVGSNIAAFALATSHPVGQQMYRRSNPFRQSSFERACARYPADSMAQEAFLEAGGPERDRLGLDPDGDGYACRWDPAPFRLARQGG